MTNETKQKFDSLKGKSFIDKQKLVFKVSGYKEFESGTVVITADTKTVNLLPQEFQAFFDSLKEVDPGIIIPEPTDKIKFPEVKTHVVSSEKKLPEAKNENTTTTELVDQNQVTSQSVTMKNALMQMLEKVSADPKLIPQAKAMVDISNTIVNIQKVELQAVDLAQRLNKKTN